MTSIPPSQMLHSNGAELRRAKPAILLQREISGSWPNCFHTNQLSQPSLCFFPFQMLGLQPLRQLKPDQFNFTTLILIAQQYSNFALRVSVVLQIMLSPNSYRRRVGMERLNGLSLVTQQGGTWAPSSISTPSILPEVTRTSMHKISSFGLCLRSILSAPLLSPGYSNTRDCLLGPLCPLFFLLPHWGASSPVLSFPRWDVPKRPPSRSWH